MLSVRAAAESTAKPAVKKAASSFNTPVQSSSQEEGACDCLFLPSNPCFE